MEIYLQKNAIKFATAQLAFETLLPGAHIKVEQMLKETEWVTVGKETLGPFGGKGVQISSQAVKVCDLLRNFDMLGEKDMSYLFDADY